jgi:hypothetical protein
LDWATSLDRLFDDPRDAQALQWAEEAIKRGDGTPGQRRALGLLTGGEDIVDLLATTPDAVRRLLDSVDAQKWEEAPGAHEWNAIQIVHHLADNEAVNAVRIRSVLTESKPEIFGYDSDPWTRFFDIEPIEHAFERLVTGRRNTVALARSLSPEDLDREGFLSYRGSESLRVLLAVLAGHDRDHLDQLKATLGV